MLTLTHTYTLMPTLTTNRNRKQSGSETTNTHTHTYRDIPYRVEIKTATIYWILDTAREAQEHCSAVKSYLLFYVFILKIASSVITLTRTEKLYLSIMSDCLSGCLSGQLIDCCRRASSARVLLLEGSTVKDTYYLFP